MANLVLKGLYFELVGPENDQFVRHLTKEEVDQFYEILLEFGLYPTVSWASRHTSGLANYINWSVEIED